MLQQLRHTLIKRLGRPLAKRTDGLYVTGEVDQREYVGLLNADKQMATTLLQRAGFRPNYLSAYKTIRGTDTTEHSSWAWRGTATDVDDASTYEYDEQSDYQVHVHLFEIDGQPNTTAVFAHYEYNWKTHPLKHYRDTPNDERGVKMAETLLSEQLSDQSVLDTHTPFKATHKPRKERTRREKAGGALADVSAVGLLVTALQTYEAEPNVAIAMALVGGLVFLAKQYHVDLAVEPNTLVPLVTEGVETVDATLDEQ